MATSRELLRSAALLQAMCSNARADLKHQETCDYCKIRPRPEGVAKRLAGLELALEVVGKAYQKELKKEMKDA